MKNRLTPALVAVAFGLVMLSGVAKAGNTELDTWSAEAFADPCMNGDVPADGIVRAGATPLPDA